MTPATASSFPSIHEIERWLSETIRHAWHIEYYLQRLQVGRSDLQRPHDIVGPGNKLEWPAIRGFAMQYRGGVDNFETYILPALTFHRQQDHHRAWNQYYPAASTDAMRLGAVDAVCSLLESRGYQGGCHSWDEIHQIAEANPIHKVAWMQLMALEMRKIDRPETSETSIYHVPKRGISPESYDAIQGRIEQARVMLQRDHDLILPETST